MGVFFQKMQNWLDRNVYNLPPDTLELFAVNDGLSGSRYFGVSQ